MADVTVPLTRMTVNTLSTDLVGGMTDHNTGETGECDLDANHTLPYMSGEDRLLVIFEEQDGAAATIVFDAGDYPPSMLKDKGALTITLAASDIKPVVLEAGRFLQNDGKITYTVTGGVKIGFFRLPYPEV